MPIGLDAMNSLLLQLHVRELDSYFHHPSEHNEVGTAMALLKLPDEVLLIIVEQLDEDPDLSVLGRTCLYLYKLLNTFLYQRNLRRYHGWGMWSSLPGPFCRC